jgi:trehalose-6-phosphate synthase
MLPPSELPRRKPNKSLARGATGKRIPSILPQVGVMSNTLINVSNRLPVTVEGDKIAKSAGGLVAALDGLSKEQYTTKWIGWPGAAFAETSREREIERVLTEEYGCVRVFLSKEDVEAHYEGFSNSSIWPLLHGSGANLKSWLCGVNGQR